jgi:asparagine synthase (glutamine-hydrolysing)
MSGIVGIVNRDGAPVPPELLDQLTSFLSFRGPDAQQTWLSPAGDAGLGYALLRTTLEAEHERQPLSLDGETWIVADARVDGRADLIQRLQARGRQVTPEAPDVELILHAYHAWGEGCVQHLIGDFAFAIWNQRERHLFCARDHFGVVPLYYAGTPAGLIFSNTLQCLRQHPSIPDTLNELAIADFLLFGGNQDRATTTFQAINRLPPAHTLTWSPAGAGLRVQPYWTPPEDAEPLRADPEEIVGEFLRRFRQAVADRLRVRNVAVTLSGGMDSSSVAATAAQVLASSGIDSALRAYTIGYEWLLPDEEPVFAGMVAHQYQIPWEVLKVDDHFLTKPEVSAAVAPAEPATGPFASGWQELRRRALSRSRVLLTGFGADPLLAMDHGYWIELLRRAQVARFFGSLFRYVTVHRRRPPIGLATARRSRQRQLPTWLNPAFVSRLDLRAHYADQLNEWAQRSLRESVALSPFWSNLFASADPGSTLSPMKVRFPFIDLRLFLYILQVPPVPWLGNKYLLRMSMSDTLPEAVRQRPKTPLRNWPMHALARRGQLPRWLLDYSFPRGLAEYVDDTALKRIVQTPEAYPDWQYQLVLRPIALAHWLARTSP